MKFSMGARLVIIIRNYTAYQEQDRMQHNRSKRVHATLNKDNMLSNTDFGSKHYD